MTYNGGDVAGVLRLNPIKILFLGANPAGTTPLDLSEEVHRIQEAINNSRSRDVLKLQTEWAVRRNDLNRLLRQHKPNVLHFSGHADSKGLVLHEEDGSTAYLTTVGLRALLEPFRDNLRLVVLNGCSTDERARAISDVVGCVVGTQREITDPAARAFSEFYGALGDGCSVSKAFEHARAQIAAERTGEEEVVKLYVRQDIEAAKWFIVPPATTLLTEGGGALSQQVVREESKIVELPFRGRPELVLEGDTTVAVASDRGEWFTLDPKGTQHLPILRGWSAAVFTDEDELTVALYDDAVAVLRDRNWELQPLEAPVLAMHPWDGCILAGTAAGGVLRVSRRASQLVLRLAEPVVGISSAAGRIVVLGGFGVLRSYDMANASIEVWASDTDIALLGRPVSFFTALQSNRAGVFSRDRIGLFDPETGSIRVSEPIDAGVGVCVPVPGTTPRYAVLTDAGDLTTLDQHLRPMSFQVSVPSHDPLVGLCLVGAGTVAAWTQAGRLLQIQLAGAVRELSIQNVALAAPVRALAGGLRVVRAQPDSRWLLDPPVALQVSR